MYEHAFTSYLLPMSDFFWQAAIFYYAKNREAKNFFKMRNEFERITRKQVTD